jgi:UDP-glucuronate decarboxylase
MMQTKDFLGPVNLGNPTELSVEGMARKIIDMTGSKSEIVFKDLPQDDPVRRKPDISLAQKELQWNPTVSLEDGLKMIIEDFKERLNQ